MELGKYHKQPDHVEKLFATAPENFAYVFRGCPLLVIMNIAWAPMHKSHG